MIDRQKAEEAFRNYAARYDPENPMIRLKIQHTFRVAALAARIAGSLPAVTEEDAGFAWFLGLLHDIGRFEQVRQYGTFVDSLSTDHAELGADLLFRDGLIRAFPVQFLSSRETRLAETAVRAHNKLALPADLDERTRRFCDILRDADKADIFRVISELPFETRIGSSAGLFPDGEEASPEVMACVLAHRCVPREARKNRFDGRISHCCLAFELVFPETRRIVLEQGWLLRLLQPLGPDGAPLWDGQKALQLQTVRREIEKAWMQPL